MEAVDSITTHGFRPRMKDYREPLVDTTLDRDWYKTYYRNEIPEGMPPNEHYSSIGQSKGCYPNRTVQRLSEAASSLDPEWYASNYKDVAGSGINPTLHYLVYGYVEGRHANKEEARFSKFKVDNFDANWYALRYPDVIENGFEPLEHYVIHGRGEGRAPNKQAAIDMKFSIHIPFIKLMHQKMLGRDATGDECQFWSDKIFNGLPLDEIAKSLASSREGIAYVDACRNITR